MKIQISQCPSLILRGRESGLYPDMIFSPNLPLEPQLLPFLESGALGSKSRAAFSIPQPRRGEAFFHFQPYLLGSSGSELPTLCYGLEPPLQHYSSVPQYPQYVHTTPTEMQGKSFLAPGKALWETSEALKKSPSLFYTAIWETQTLSHSQETVVSFVFSLLRRHRPHDWSIC